MVVYRLRWDKGTVSHSDRSLLHLEFGLRESQAEHQVARGRWDSASQGRTSWHSGVAAWSLALDEGAACVANWSEKVKVSS